MRKAITLLLFLIISAAAIADNIRFKVSGHVLDNRTMQPIQYAIVKVSNLELWAATDANGMFIIENVPQGAVSIEVSTLGYVTRTVQFNIRHNTDLKNIRLKEANLSIPGVEVTARKRSTMVPRHILSTVPHSTTLRSCRLTILWPCCPAARPSTPL